MTHGSALNEHATQEQENLLPHPPQIYPTMLSEFIRELKAEYLLHGDMPVMARGIDNWRTSRVVVVREPYYWDGGGLHPTQPGPYACSRWVRSKHRHEHPYHILIDAGNPEVAFSEDPLGTRDTIDGAPMEALPDD